MPGSARSSAASSRCARARVLVAAAAASARTCAAHPRSRSRATAGAEQFVDLTPGSGPRPSRGAGRGRRRARPLDVPRRALADRRRAAPEGRRVPVRPADDAPLEVVEKLARGDVYLRPITFPEGLTIARWRRIFERAGLAQRRGVRRAPRATRRCVQDLDPGGPRPRGLPLPRHLRAAAARRRRRPRAA